jgi:uncharacterized membrane protein YdbT with pleckstrin-like domain
VAAALVFIGLEILYETQWRDQVSPWAMALPPLVLLWPLARWIRRQSNKTIVTADRLRADTGFASRSSRTIQLAKLQDVRVEQSLGQRMFDVGNISMETAGEASRFTLRNVDAPHALADEILNRAGKAAGAVGT